MRKKEKEKAFTLIELLAVIIILGVLMIIAIPNVTSYISDSRKSSYVSTAKNIVSGARTKVNEGKLSMFDTSTTYYLPYDLINTETEAKTPYGDFKEGYIVVTFDGNGYDYYWTSTDTSEMGIYLTYNDALDNERIKTAVTTIPTNVGICGKDNIVVYNNDGTVKVNKKAKKCIPEKGSYDKTDDDTSSSVTASYFDFDPTTGTITGLHDSVDIELTDYNTCANYLQQIGWYSSKSEAYEYCANDFIEDMASYSSEQEINEFKNANVITVNQYSEYPKNLVIPEEINGVKVVSIGNDSLSGHKLTSVTLPSTLKTIEDSAFSYNDFTTITIPNGVTKIGNSAFSGTELKTVTLPSTLKTIGDYAFSGTNLYKVTIPNSVTYIGSHAFADTGFLYEVVNKTGDEFNWGNIFGLYQSNSTFESGMFEHYIDDAAYNHNGYLLTNPKWVTKYITTTDEITIDMDSMFDYGPHHFNLKNSNGYKVYSYERAARKYLLNVSGEMKHIDGYCCEVLVNFYLEDSSGDIIYSGLYRYVIDNCAC